MRGRGYDLKYREQARDMYVYQEMSVAQIAEALRIPIGTIGRWQVEDKWTQDRSDQAGETFAQTCNYLMRTMHRMSERLFQSTIPPDPNADFFLPDENLELRINRLTLALERIQPMGNMLLKKHRVDVIREVKEYGFAAVAKSSLEEHELVAAFKLLEGYLNTLEISQKAI